MRFTDKQLIILLMAVIAALLSPVWYLAGDIWDGDEAQKTITGIVQSVVALGGGSWFFSSRKTPQRIDTSSADYLAGVSDAKAEHRRKQSLGS